MNIRFPVRVSWIVQCHRCHVEYVTTPAMVPAEGVVPEPSLPSGWTVVNDRVFCNQHTILFGDTNPTAAGVWFSWSSELPSATAPSHDPSEPR